VRRGPATPLGSRHPADTGRRKSPFEIEELEPRVLLSGDALPASIVATNALRHRPVEVVHHDPAPGAETFQDSISYHPANEVAEMFAGVASETVRSDVQSPGHPVQNDAGAMRAKTATLTAANGPPVSTVLAQTVGKPTGVSASSSSNGANAGSLHNLHNGTGTIDLLQSITGDLQTFGSSDNTTPSPIDLGDATLAGVLPATGIQLSFSGLNISGGSVSAGTVNITASSASLNLGGAVTSTIGSITGSYDIASKTFSLTLNTVNLAFSSFVNISANSASLTYNSTSTTSVTLSDGTTAAVSLLTVGMSGASVFAGVNGPASDANAEGLSLTGVNLAVALMGTAGGTNYYGLRATGGVLAAVGLPSTLTVSSSNLEIDASGASSGSVAVNFDTTFVAGTGLAVSTGGGNINLDFKQPVVQASGTVVLNFNGFVEISGSMVFQTGTTTNVTLSDGTTSQVSVLEAGGTGMTIFAGVNGPGTNPGAVGVQATGAGFALALFRPTSATDTSSYFGLQASATSMAAVGMPAEVTVSAGNLNVQINGGNGSKVVNFDTSFTPGTGLTIQTGGTPVKLDYTAPLTQVSGTLAMAFTGFVNISGGFAFSQSGGTVNINIGTSAFPGATALNFTLGFGGATFISATGALVMSIDADSISITTATLTVNSGFNIPNILAVASPVVALSTITITDATGQISGAVVNGNATAPDLTISAGSATVLPGNSAVTATVSPTSPGGNGVQGVFNLQSGAFTITLQQFALTVGSVLSANATNVVISYNPTDIDPHQQLVQIGSGTITINSGFGSGTNGPFSGNLTNLTIYANGFQFNSVTVAYNGTLSLGSVLNLTNPSVTLTDFSVTFGSGNTTFSESGSLAVTASSASLNLGAAVTSSIGAVAGSYDPSSGAFSLTLNSVSLAFSSFVSINAASASLTYNRTSSTTATLSDGSTASVSLLTVGISSASVFAGVNGPASNANAEGLSLTGANLALALMSTSGGTSYYGLRVTGGTLSAVGLPSSLTLSSTNLEADVNGASAGSAAVNFDTTFGAGTGLAVSTGSSNINLDFKQPVVQASGTVVLNFNGFVYISGSMSFQTGTTTTVTLSDGTTKQVSVLQAGGADVTIFAGVNGPGTNSAAVGLQATGVGFALALFKPTSATDTNSYFGLEAGATSVSGVGMPAGVIVSAGNLSVQINSGSSNTAVNFDTTFGAGTGLAVPTGGGTSINLDFKQPVIQVSGTMQLNLDGFVYISGSMAFQTGTTTTVTLSDGTTKQVSVLEVGGASVAIFAGVNGPGTNSGAVGVQATGVGFALALFKPTSATDTSSYFGLEASATSISTVGMPSGVTLSAGNLNVQINSGSSNTAVNFDTSFKPGTGLAIQTGGTPVNLDYTGLLTQVSGSLALAFSSYISISGGFAFSESGGTVNINLGTGAFSGAAALSFTLSSGGTTFFSATGGLAMSIDADSVSISSATLTVNSGFSIPNILAVSSPTVTISGLVINNATGQISGAVVNGNSTDPDLTITAGSATVLPGNTTVTASVTPASPGGNGVQGVFNLATGAFTITLQQFALTVGSVLTAGATNVVLSYNPADTDPHQQLVQIGAGTLDIKLGTSDITGSLTNLTIYADGFQFDSVTINYTGQINLGSILTLTNPTVTLTDFGVTFGGGNATFTDSGSLTVTVASGSMTLGPVNGSASTLSATVSLAPATLGALTVTAGELDFAFATNLSVQAMNIAINTNPGSGGTYFSVGTASVTLTVTSSFSIAGTASNFSVVNSGGTPTLQTGNGFGITLTPPSPSQLGLPDWLGFAINQFGISWPDSDFATNPADFQLTLSANINSIQGLPSGVKVSGSISDVVINLGELATWLTNPGSANFPLSFGTTSGAGIGGSLSGTLFGMDLSATFVGGIVSFNKEGDVISNGKVVAGTNDPTDPKVYGSGIFVGVQGSAGIPGIGTISISLGFSNLGPLSIYLSYTATTPLIIDPDSGLAIAGLSGGIAFDTSMQTPTSATDLPGILAGAMTSISGSPTGQPSTTSIADWTQSLELATAAQYVASGGGKNLSAAYSQPFLIMAGVTIDDAYLSQYAIELQGTMVLGINPNPGPRQAPVSILISGSLILADSSALSAASAYLYASVSSSSASLLFLVNDPIQLEEFGGGLTFGFTKGGNPWSAGDSGLPDGFDLSITGFFAYAIPNPLSTTVPPQNLASVSVNGTVTLSVSISQAKIDLSGDVNVSFLGDLGDATGEFVLLYPGSTYTDATGATPSFVNNSVLPDIYGALELYTGSAFDKLASLGLVANGAVLFQANTSGNNVLVNLPPPPSAPAGTAPSPLVIQGSVLFDMTITGTSTPYATISYEVDGDTLFQMEGFFDLRFTLDPTYGPGVQMFADINTLTLGPSSSPFLSFSGFGLFVLNGQGLAADVNLNLNSGNAISGVSFSAKFNLVINTTAQAVTFNIPAVTVPTSPAGSTATAGVTIYDSNNNPLPNPATSLIIPAGPPLVPLTEAQISGVWTGSYTTSGAAGPYVVVTGSGNLALEGLTLNGSFYFQMSDSPETGFVLALAVDVSGNVPSVGTATVTGSLNITNAGEVALLNVSDSGSSPTDYGSGITFQVNAQLGINTTDQDVTEIGGVTLSSPLLANSYEVEAAGTLTLSVGGVGFVINGVFSLTTTHSDAGMADDISTTTIQAGGALTATEGGSTLLSMQVSGVLSARYTTASGTGSATVYGALVLTPSGGNPLSGNGFSFSGSFLLEVNTTGARQSPTDASNNPLMFDGQAVTLAAGPDNSTTGSNYAQIYAVGTLTFGTATDGFVLVADPAAVTPTDPTLGFYLSFGTSGAGLFVTAGARMSIMVDGMNLLTVGADGAMLISSTGFAASLTATATLTDPSSMYAFNGTFTLQVNTTGATQTIGTATVPAAPNGSTNSTGAPYFQMHIQGSLALGSTNTSSGTGVLMAGDFYLTTSPDGLAITTVSSLNLEVSGTTLFAFTANGPLLITSSGIAGQINLTLGAGSSDSGFSFDSAVTFILEVNSTGAAISTINGAAVNLPAGPYFQVTAAGKLVLQGNVDLTGGFMLTVPSGSASVVVNINASLGLFGNIFTVTGEAGIYNSGGANGIVINITLGLNGSTSPTVYFIPGVLAVSGTFQLEINTSSSSQLGVSGNTAFDVNTGNASVYIYGFLLTSGGFDIVENNGVLSAAGTCSFNFFGYDSFNVAFYFDSNGNYWFYGTDQVLLGDNTTNINGMLTVEIASNSVVGDSNNQTDGLYGSPPVKISQTFEMEVDGGATGFGLTFASVSADVQLNGDSVSISASVTVAGVSQTIPVFLGYLANVPTPPPPNLGAVVSGVLDLNITQSSQVYEISQNNGPAILLTDPPPAVVLPKLKTLFPVAPPVR